VRASLGAWLRDAFARIPVQPAAEHHVWTQSFRLPAQPQKNRLRHILGTLPVATNQPQSRRIHQVDVPPDQFPKGLFRPALDKLSQQLTALIHRLQPLKSRGA